MSQSPQSDLVEFAEEEIPEAASPDQAWKLLIVDDEQEVHSVTKLALDGFRFAGRTLAFLGAYSGAQAREILRGHGDIAVILLDVVMETEHSGLELVRYIREALNNSFVRIILRTGQPGQAPERDVVTQYDINDYKEKTELTSQKLFTVVYTALSTYRSLRTLDANRRGLTKVIEASSTILKHQSVERFVHGVIEQVAALLFLEDDMVLVKCSGIAAECTPDCQVILATTGTDLAYLGRDPREVLPAEINEPIQRALGLKQNVIDPNYFCGYICTQTGMEAVICISGNRPLVLPDWHLIDLFLRNVTVGLENLHLRQEIDTAQQEAVYLLAEAVETRSHETGNHARRVGEFSAELARTAGLGERESEILRTAAPLHDVGKIGIPDHILGRPGRLDGDDWQRMKTHAEIGARLLSRSNRPILKAATIIAAQHHENWDGSGYPQGFSSDEIHIYGRIVALADVFDALISERSYKPAWPMREVAAYIKQERGKKFDPTLVDLLFENFELFKAIHTRFPD